MSYTVKNGTWCKENGQDYFSCTEVGFRAALKAGEITAGTKVVLHDRKWDAGDLKTSMSPTVPEGFFKPEGQEFDTSVYTELAEIYPDGHLPDLRECVLVGAGENETLSIAEHDVFTAGEFKDDQMQEIEYVVNDPGHTHAVVDPGHVHVIDKSAFNHTHGVIDLGHSHVATVRNHTHRITAEFDPHTHTIENTEYAGQFGYIDNAYDLNDGIVKRNETPDTNIRRISTSIGTGCMFSIENDLATETEPATITATFEMEPASGLVTIQPDGTHITIDPYTAEYDVDTSNVTTGITLNNEVTGITIENAAGIRTGNNTRTKQYGVYYYIAF